MRHRQGALAQLGERYNGIVEVRGSTPLGSTKSRQHRRAEKTGARPGLLRFRPLFRPTCRSSGQEVVAARAGPMPAAPLGSKT